ncbi:hypothetical protein STRIP9103_04050 [Streptomyces ipomoeae 91-03]|uniref:Uncharacterized protein n=1 Tax=Streptomyces ipomoeae 91-03 TaxID=698759 RepID=L1L0L8_9ACTN|nr:hypothetical protein STRIP9103_04050 [Streptomyces ipomoeae 91-03]
MDVPDAVGDLVGVREGEGCDSGEEGGGAAAVGAGALEVARVVVMGALLS